MLYELNGMTIRIPDEIYFKLTDDELKDYISNASAYEIQNPFFESALESSGLIILEDFDVLLEDVEEIDEEFFDKDE